MDEAVERIKWTGSIEIESVPEIRDESIETDLNLDDVMLWSSDQSDMEVYFYGDQIENHPGAEMLAFYLQDSESVIKVSKSGFDNFSSFAEKYIEEDYRDLISDQICRGSPYKRLLDAFLSSEDPSIYEDDLDDLSDMIEPELGVKLVEEGYFSFEN